MKNAAYLLLLFLVFSGSNGYCEGEQKNSSKDSSFTFEVSFWKPLIFGGYTQVREWEYVGQKYKLNEDLGLNSLDVLDFKFSYRISESNRLCLLIGRDFFRGQQLLTQNGYYNGTELKANTVACIDASRYLRAMILDYITLAESKNEMLQLICGISLDAIRFSVDAQFTDNTPRKETFEEFDRQLVPVPILGINWNKNINNETAFHIEAKAGTWPGLNTWYDESGTIKIWQYNFETCVGITKDFGQIKSELNLNYRLIYIKGESNEDTNEIFIHGFGPELKVIYQF